MKTYQHTQPGPLIVIAMLAAFAFFVWLGIFVLRPFLATAPLFLLGGWLFRSLTIEVGDGYLRWGFGPGFIQKHVALADIESVKIVRTNFLEGWGIHLSRFGWLYNIAGYDAVAVTMRGGKRFALGTDEPAILAAAITENLK